jgi:hypothetical protein
MDHHIAECSKKRSSLHFSKFTKKFFIFQQDGAPAHYARQVRDLLDETFDKWLGRRGPWEWPSRSSDFTVTDFFLWRYLKEKVFARGPRDLDELRRYNGRVHRDTSGHDTKGLQDRFCTLSGMYSA